MRLKLTADRHAFNQLATASQSQRTDLALALVALWLARLTGRMDYAAGFIFMRRMGSAALTATGPVLNVLPLAVNIRAQETLPELAQRLAGQMKNDAPPISVMTPSRSCATAGAPPATKRCLARCSTLKYSIISWILLAFRRSLTPFATGPVNDLEMALFPDEQGGLSIEILANKQRYDEATLVRHVERLHGLLAQFAANIDLRCGEAENGV